MAQKKTPPGKKPKLENDDDKDLEGADPEDNDSEDDEDETDPEAENRRINAIVTSRVKREMKAVNTQLQALMSKLETMSTPAKKDETDDEDEENTEAKTPQLDPKLSKKMTKLEKELAEEKAARKKAEEERSAEQERGKKQEMRNIFSSVLTELGVTDPKLLRAALNMLDEDGVMIRDEDGKIKFKGQDKYGIETNFDPKTGLKAWVSGEGKSFIPAVEAGGSGTGGARGTGNGTASLTARDIKKLSPQQLASINLERACSGLPPLGEDQQ